MSRHWSKRHSWRYPHIRLLYHRFPENIWHHSPHKQGYPRGIRKLWSDPPMLRILKDYITYYFNKNPFNKPTIVAELELCSADAGVSIAALIAGGLNSHRS